jgi:hypothetical protein
MDVLLRLIRHRGAPLKRSVIDATRWTEGRLCMTQQHGSRCLGIMGIMSRPDGAPMAVLFSPTVARVEGDALILRGIERSEDERGTVAAVVQEWAIKHRPSLGPMGLMAPEAKERRADMRSTRRSAALVFFGAVWAV